MNWQEGEAPEGWTLAALSDVAKVTGGGTPKTTIPGNFSETEGYPWITPADLTNYTEKRIRRGRRFLTEQGLASSSAKILPAGTVLFSSRAPIGYVAIADTPVTTNQGFRSFTPGESLDSDYLYYALQFLRPVAEQLASGTTFPEISGTKAGQMKIAFPDVHEQRVIAHLLDQGVEHSHSASAHLKLARRAVERFRQAVLAAACFGRLTADWRECNSVSSELVRSRVAAWSQERSVKLGKRSQVSAIPDTFELESLPDGWEWHSLSELVLRIGDADHRMPKAQTAGTPYISTKDFTESGIDFEHAKKISSEDFSSLTRKIKPDKGDILISRYGTVGQVRMVTTSDPFQASYSVAIVKTFSDLTLAQWISTALRSSIAQTFMLQHIRASAQPDLGLQHIRQIPIPVPSIEEQAEIVRRVGELLSHADSISLAINRSSRSVDWTSQSVLAKAFRGEFVSTTEGKPLVRSGV